MTMVRITIDASGVRTTGLYACTGNTTRQVNYKFYQMVIAVLGNLYMHVDKGKQVQTLNLLVILVRKIVFSC